MFNSLAMSFHPGGLERLKEYAIRKGLSIEKELGIGFDGIVAGTSSRTAIKAVTHNILYERERNAYLRFQERGVEKIEGFAVPILIEFDDQLQIIEMSIVSPPRIVDFAGAGLDGPIVEFSSEDIEAKLVEWQEAFGDDWTRVEDLLSGLRQIGIYLSDVNTNNIRTS